MLPANIQALLDVIPIAEDGQVITAEDHNTLRDAILALAGLGEAPGVSTHVLTLAPVFINDSTLGPWDQQVGWASKGNVASSGWFPVQLPAGAQIVKMAVSCFRNPPTGPLVVSLIKQFANEARKEDGSDLVASVVFPATTVRTVGSGTLGATFGGNFANLASRTSLQSNFPIGPVLVALTGLDEREGQTNANNSLIDGDFKYLVEARLQSAATAVTGGSTQIARIQIFYTI